MKLKGYWAEGTEYDIGDVVIYDDVVYSLQKPDIAGTTPKETLCWGRLNQPLSEVVLLIMDGLVIANGEAQALASSEVEKYFVNEQTLVLKTGEGDDIKSYAITVDDSGETPDLAVDLIEEEEEEEGGDT